MKDLSLERKAWKQESSESLSWACWKQEKIKETRRGRDIWLALCESQTGPTQGYASQLAWSGVTAY